MVRNALGWFLTPLHLFAFAAILLFFHPVLVAARRVGYLAHKRIVDYANLSVLTSLKLVGTRFELISDHPLPEDRPLIVVSNHQSMYDIPLLGWTFRAHHPKFVAKVELGRGLPSISFNLRHGGSVLIDRSNPRQALPALARFGQYIERHRYAACIFPEGTRALDGVLKPFNPAGLLKLLQNVPSALIVPVAIQGSWELVRYRFCPIPFRAHLRCTVLEPVEPRGRPDKAMVKLVEDKIRAQLEALPTGDSDPAGSSGVGAGGRSLTRHDEIAG